jgi:segregation and condensation protein A
MFEGPVELLLYLVRQNELDVCDVPIGRLTDDYLGYIRQVRRLDLEVASDFLIMAGVLVRLKVRRLVPNQPDEDTDTPTVTLDQILDDFRRYQRVAELLGTKEAERRLVFPRKGEAPRSALAESEDMTLLAAALQRVLTRLGPEKRVTIEPRPVRIEDKLAALRMLLAQRRVVTFEEAVSGQTLTEVIVMFLAVLELVRLGEVWVRQSAEFDTILLEQRLSPAPA